MGSELYHSNTFKNFFVKNLTKIKLIKGFLLNDDSAMDLLIHCYEEMNHPVGFSKIYIKNSEKLEI